MATTATLAVTTVAMAPGASGNSHAAEEDAAKKKNTDCVYFLASPLTCKKGDECEFRHNENARMNPRDCWYWVGGGCRNRDCSFRHPPLETRATPTPTPAPPSTPVHPKKPVPCFFFSQGCCNKGSKCQFLHEGSGAPNVYRLSDKSPSSERKLGEQATEATPDKSSASSSKATRAGKVHKDIYTWKLSDKPPGEKPSEKPVEKKPVEKKAESSESDRRKSKEPTSSGSRNEEDFAAPKSLAQIKEEKLKNGDVSKRKLDSSRDRGDSVRRKLCNGSAESAPEAEIEGGIDERDIEIDQEEQQQEEQQGEDEDVDDEDDDDFAKRLEALSRTK